MVPLAAAGVGWASVVSGRARRRPRPCSRRPTDPGPPSAATGGGEGAHPARAARPRLLAARLPPPQPQPEPQPAGALAAAAATAAPTEQEPQPDQRAALGGGRHQWPVPRTRQREGEGERAQATIQVRREGGRDGGWEDEGEKRFCEKCNGALFFCLFGLSECLNV